MKELNKIVKENIRSYLKWRRVNPKKSFIHSDKPLFNDKPLADGSYTYIINSDGSIDNKDCIVMRKKGDRSFYSRDIETLEAFIEAIENAIETLKPNRRAYVDAKTDKVFLYKNEYITEMRECDMYLETGTKADCECILEYETDEDGNYIKDENGNYIETEDSTHNIILGIDVWDGHNIVTKVYGEDFSESKEKKYEYVNWDAEWVGRTILDRASRKTIYLSSSERFTFTVKNGECYWQIAFVDIEENEDNFNNNYNDEEQ